MPALPYRGLMSGDTAQPDASTAPRGLAAGADTPPDDSLMGQVTQFPGNVAKLASAFYNHPSVIAPAVGQTALDMTGFPAFQAGVQHTAQGNEPAAISDAMNIAGSLGFGGMGASHITGDVGDLGMAAGRGHFDLDYFGQPITIHQNPTPTATMGLINRSKYQALRRIIDGPTGDAYVWDGAAPALHHHVAKSLGIDPETMKADVITNDR